MATAAEAIARRGELGQSWACLSRDEAGGESASHDASLTVAIAAVHVKTASAVKAHRVAIAVSAVFARFISPWSRSPGDHRARRDDDRYPVRAALQQTCKPRRIDTGSARATVRLGMRFPQVPAGSSPASAPAGPTPVRPGRRATGSDRGQREADPARPAGTVPAPVAGGSAAPDAEPSGERTGGRTVPAVACGRGVPGRRAPARWPNDGESRSSHAPTDHAPADGNVHRGVYGGHAGVASAGRRRRVRRADRRPRRAARTRGPRPANDGWAAAGAGTTGGSAADEANVFVARNRAEFVAAVTGNTPKIVFVSGKSWPTSTTPTSR